MSADRGGCPAPFFQDTLFTDGGFVEGRLCSSVLGNITCCLPCPMTQWAYPDSFETMNAAANWVAVASTVCCVVLLLSWAVLPVDKTFRHYLSISLTAAVMFMNLGFVIPLAGNPEQCYDTITPNSMQTSSMCAASGFFIIMGGWAGVMWVFLRALSLHLQICWQLVVGRNFMWFSQAVGWGLPAVGVVLAFILSGVSFRFGQTCHINHRNSLADLWIPLLVFAGFTIIIQFATFGYCIKVYLASLADNSASTEGSNLPSYTNSIRTMTPKQAYRRVRRVIALQWRGIAIVLIIIADVIFFSVVFVFQDNTVEQVKHDQSIAMPWVTCLYFSRGDKNACLEEAKPLVVNQATVGAVLFLLGMNGIWLAFFLGRWSMITGWRDLLISVPNRSKREFVSVDARLDDFKKDTRSYEMLSRDSGKTMDDSVTPSLVTPISPTYARSPVGSPIHHDYIPNNEGRRTPDYFGQTARYHTPARSFSSPRPPQTVTWDARETYARGQSPYPEEDRYVNPLGMNRI
ncbi:Frizzled/smoothened-like sans CRD protein B [Madurella fahalii]|uniref:Frizzled/smoothened-like sans CRD protein B n=1 Tax=Madurella fahalii TaxID=1157608 RepID=A0ABQ0FXM3_9PEZI